MRKTRRIRKGGYRFLQVDNSDIASKWALRRAVLKIVAVQEPPLVLNTLPGADNVIGRIYERRDEVEVVHLADMKKLEGHDRFSEFNVFDIDVYSNPYPIFQRVLDARADRDFVLVGTDAGKIHLQLGVLDPRNHKRFAGHEAAKKWYNYERYILRRGFEMVGDNLKMMALWKKGKSVMYFAWFLGRFAQDLKEGSVDGPCVALDA